MKTNGIHSMDIQHIHHSKHFISYQSHISIASATFENSHLIALVKDGQRCRTWVFIIFQYFSYVTELKNLQMVFSAHIHNTPAKNVISISPIAFAQAVCTVRTYDSQLGWILRTSHLYSKSFICIF